MKNRYFFHLLVVLLSFGLSARATTPPPANGHSLAEALNPDGTLKMGASGSFDARQFRMGTAPDGRPVFRPAGTKGAGDERWQNGFGLPNGVNGPVQVVVQAGTDMYIAGSFIVAGSLMTNHVAKWNGTTWSTLGAGIGDEGSSTAVVYALAVAANGDVYAGGEFTRAGGAAATNVARWNGTAWSSLGTGTSNGVNGRVSALAVTSSGDVYVGGYFTQAGGTAANYVARWNGTAWSSLGTGAANGVNSPVRALAVAGNGEVYVGGQFTQAGGATASRVARWNGTAWSTLGTGTTNGVNGYVTALTIASTGDLYAGGDFTQAGGTVANKVAKWNGTAWSSLGTGTANGLGSVVYALALAPNGDVYVGGYFTQAGGTAANYVTRWNGTAWSSLGTGTANGVNGSVQALAVASNGDVYVGGHFTQASGIVAGKVSRWSGTAWSSLGNSAANGVNDSVHALAVAPNGDVYVGGFFTQVGGSGIMASVVKWNGTAWSALGNGPNGGDVWAMALAPNGDLYVAGSFTQADGVVANRIARWNGTAWNALGNGVNSFVYALAVAANGDVYAGGQFTQAGGVAANYVAKWNGTVWSSLGTGTANGVSPLGLGRVLVDALAFGSGGELYVAGYFAQAGGMVANNVARWDGTTWSSLGTGTTNGVNDLVYALVRAANGDLYVGGRFTQAGAVATNYIAKWNGTTWSSLGTGTSNGVSGNVSALAVTSSGDVYIGGGFGQPNAGMANSIVKWDGTTWSNLGTGIYGTVYAIGIGPTGKVIVGGGISGTGDLSKVMANFAIYDPSAPLATTAPKAAPAGQLYPNPAHGTATLRLPATAPRQPLTLTDALGRVVRRYPAPATADVELDLRGLPVGSYVVRCGAVSQRLVVE